MDLVDRLAALRAKPERLALGLMSGMSVDGLDLALVRIRDREPRPDVQLVATGTVPYDAALVATIRRATAGTTRDVCLLSFELAVARLHPMDETLLHTHGLVRKL